MIMKKKKWIQKGETDKQNLPIPTQSVFTKELSNFRKGKI